MATHRDLSGVRVWDLPVRVVHWSLALACAAAWFTSEYFLQWHEPIGYAALALVAARVVWGFAGGRHARFSNFLRAPHATWAYARRVAAGTAERYLGHNPLGGWMAVALWSCVAALCVTGWLYTTDFFWGEAWLNRLHLVLAWLLVVLVAVHVAGVVSTSRKTRERLVESMFSGRKQPARPGDVD